MTLRLLLVIVAASMLSHIQARAQDTAEPSASCRTAANTAEHDWNIPPRLLVAIGKRESGRGDEGASWPWTINAGGRAIYSDTKQAAVLQVQALQAAGVRSIDVGCFQINLAAHPLAFATLEAAFDPIANGAYAARFLDSLHGRTGSWGAAVAAYHSLTPGIGDPYRAAVLAEWLQPNAMDDTHRAHFAVFGVPVMVWGPSGPSTAGEDQGVGLPRVITPMSEGNVLAAPATTPL